MTGEVLDAVSFDALAAFLKRASGITLTPEKMYLVQSRLQPVAKAAGHASLFALVAALRLGDPMLQRTVVEAMTTNETSFFRDGNPFDLFRSTVLPFLTGRRAARKTIRVLCAAASSGQEPYSLAMLLQEERHRLAGWRVEIQAVDIDESILSKAREGVYSAFEVQRGVPHTFLGRYFEALADGAWRIKADVRSMVTFRQFNLLDSMAGLGTFDVVFCRNVLIYFDEATKAGVLAKISQQMPEDGFLFLGGAETVLGITDRFQPVPGRRGIYVRARAAERKLAA
jgi:chemotaxis protein methyltransferase CheR